ncbi:cyclin-dependent kinase inhibitor 3-like [Diadema antillarum]|uniref:cyclin-dependent kinase inhibitor 3-like n=1 Tax=Diadema antillarum TaxID=105358 RepID=UPI003A899A7F
MGVATEMPELKDQSRREDGASSGFDSSDDENEAIDKSPFNISWMDLSEYGISEKLGVSGLPGCRFDETWRSIESDVSSLISQGVEEVFVLCTRGELYKYRVPRLLQEYTTAGLAVHHYPFPDGLVPSPGNCLKMLDEIRLNLVAERGTLVHCYGGIGRAALIAACLLLMVDEYMDWKDAITKIRQLKGSRAIQTVKQYNFVNDFRKMREEYESSIPDSDRRSISR